MLAVVASLGSCSDAEPSLDPVRAFDQRLEMPVTRDNIPQRFPTYGPNPNWVASGFFRGDDPEAKSHFWIVHPPIAFARDLLGEETFGRCVEAIRGGAATTCKVDTSCADLRITRTGYVEMKVWAPCLGGELGFEGTNLELLDVEITPAPGQYVPEP